MPSYYSIIRYLPDPISEEAINVGVVVFGEGKRPQFRFTSDWTRRQFGGESVEFLQRLASQLNSRQQVIFGDSGSWDEEGLRRVLGRWHNSVQFTPPRASLQDPARLVEEVATSFLRESVRREILRGTRLNSTVRTMFRRMRVLATSPTEVTKHRVVTDYRIDKKTGLYAEFAVKNGAFHVIETIDYRSAVPSAKPKFYETGAKALVLSAAKEKLGKGTKTYVVYSARTEDRSSIKSYIALLEEHADNIFNFESKKDLASFGSSMKRVTGGTDLAHAGER